MGTRATGGAEIYKTVTAAQRAIDSISCFSDYFSMEELF
jgi:hypothetical protein